MTGGSGDRIHGFCRRVLSQKRITENSTARYPMVLCVMCEHLWFTFFYKVLEVVEELLKQEGLFTGESPGKIPTASHAVTFLRLICVQLSTTPRPGQILRVPFPDTAEPLAIEPPLRISSLAEPKPDVLQCTSSFIELQIPPSLGGDMSFGGVSLSRLVWHVPSQCLVTLFAGLLLERRVVMVSQHRERLSAAVHAAAALIYPFKWHHVYLPLMPSSLQDYLQAPMPFIIGLPAQLLHAVEDPQMSEVTLVDLDRGSTEPVPGSSGDDAHVLPYRERLEGALAEAMSGLRSPYEFEGNTAIHGVITDFFVKLFKNYRRFISKRSTGSNGFGGNGIGSNGSAGKLARSRGPAEDEDNGLFGYGYYFDYVSFVASHRRNEQARQFLTLFRHSQMFEMFVQERLQMASKGHFPSDDAFEYKINLLEEQGARRKLGLKPAVKSLSRRIASRKHLNVSGTFIHRNPTMLSDMAPAALKKAISRASSPDSHLGGRSPLASGQSKSEPQSPGLANKSGPTRVYAHRKSLSTDSDLHAVRSGASFASREDSNSGLEGNRSFDLSHSGMHRLGSAPSIGDLIHFSYSDDSDVDGPHPSAQQPATEPATAEIAVTSTNKKMASNAEDAISVLSAALQNSLPGGADAADEKSTGSTWSRVNSLRGWASNDQVPGDGVASAGTPPQVSSCSPIVAGATQTRTSTGGWVDFSTPGPSRLPNPMVDTTPVPFNRMAQTGYTPGWGSTFAQPSTSAHSMVLPAWPSCSPPPRGYTLASGSAGVWERQMGALASGSISPPQRTTAHSFSRSCVLPDELTVSPGSGSYEDDGEGGLKQTMRARSSKMLAHMVDANLRSFDQLGQGLWRPGVPSEGPAPVPTSAMRPGSP